MDTLLAALPAGVPPSLAAAAFLAALLLAYTALSAALRRKDLPPMVSCGVPLVGGFIKFLQASRDLAHSLQSLPSLACALLRPCWTAPAAQTPPALRRPGLAGAQRKPERPSSFLRQLRRDRSHGSLQGPLPLMEKAYKTHGQVFTVPLFHRRVTFLIGPEGGSPLRARPLACADAASRPASLRTLLQGEPPPPARAGGCPAHRWARRRQTSR